MHSFHTCAGAYSKKHTIKAPTCFHTSPAHADIETTCPLVFSSHIQLSVLPSTPKQIQ